MFEKKLREFFCFVMWGLIMGFSPEDLSRLNTESIINTRITALVVKRLNTVVKMYIDEEDPDEYNDQLESIEEDFCEKCMKRWKELQQLNDPVRSMIARLSKSHPHFTLDMRDRLSEEIDQTDLYWKKPQSQKDVWDYIHGLRGWSEL